MKRKGIFTTENRESTEAISVANTHDLPEGFQMTELGPLPKEWRVVRLGEVARMKQGRVLPTSSFTRHGYPVYGANGQIGWFDQYTHTEEEVLVTCRGATCGTINISPPKSFITNNAMIVTPIRNDQLRKDYLAFALQVADLVSCITGSGQPQITKGKLSLIQIPLPPLPEQRAIAHVLRTVERAKEATEGVIAALKELKKSLMQHLFTYGPVPATERERVPLQESEIGPLPAHWRVVRLGEVVDVKGGKRLPKGDEFASNPTPYPYIRIVDFKNGSVDIRNLKFLTEEQHILLNRYIITSNDVYISIAGTIGLVGSVPEELNGAHLTENAARLILNTNRLYRQFLVVALQSDMVQAQIQARATKTSQPKLALARIKEIPIPLPPLDEQREIARMLQAVDAKIAAEQARRAALEELFKSLLHLLMTGKVRVKEDLGSQNANS
jgi:type I restriction enzyme S subunit